MILSTAGAVPKRSTIPSGLRSEAGADVRFPAVCLHHNEAGASASETPESLYGHPQARAPPGQVVRKPP